MRRPNLSMRKRAARNASWLIYSAIVITILIVNSYFAAQILYTPRSRGARLVTYIVNANADTVLLIYPDYNASHRKPDNVRPASKSDFGIYYQAVGIVSATAQNPQIEAVDTSKYVDPSTGIPKPEFTGALVILGGPGFNVAVHGYENFGEAPVIVDESDSANFYFRNVTGTRFESTSMPKIALAGNSTDIFVIESFTDHYNRPVFMMYGYGSLGTWAAAIYYKFTLLPNAAELSDDYYIVKWSDATSGPSANRFPDPGDNYTLLVGGRTQSFMPTSVPDVFGQYIAYTYLAVVVLIMVGVAVWKRWLAVVVERKT